MDPKDLISGANSPQGVWLLPVTLWLWQLHHWGRTGQSREGMLSRQHLSCFLQTSLNTSVDELCKRICSDFIYVSQSVVPKRWLPARPQVGLEILHVRSQLSAMACPSVHQSVSQTQHERRKLQTSTISMPCSHSRTLPSAKCFLSQEAETSPPQSPTSVDSMTLGSCYSWETWSSKVKYYTNMSPDSCDNESGKRYDAFALTYVLPKHI